MKNVNNWKLIAVLAGLIAIFAGVKTFLSPTLESSLPAALAEIDSSKVTELVIRPARERGTEIHLTREGNHWTLTSGDRFGRMEQGGSATAMASLMRLKPQRMISKKRTKWNEFNVGDSTGTRVRVIAGNSPAADLWVGRTGFATGADGRFMGGGFTYVRVEGEDEVYAVEGFLEGQFNRGFNDWRDKSFTRLKRDSVDRIVFRYPADSSFVIEKKNGKWMSGAYLADSAAVATYINSFEYKNVTSFAAVAPAGEPAAVITFEKGSRTVARIEGWPSSGAWTLRSSQQPNTFFSSEGTVATDIWKGRTELIKKSPKQ